MLLYFYYRLFQKSDVIPGKVGIFFFMFYHTTMQNWPYQKDSKSPHIFAVPHELESIGQFVVKCLSSLLKIICFFFLASYAYHTKAQSWHPSPNTLITRRSRCAQTVEKKMLCTKLWRNPLCAHKISLG